MPIRTAQISLMLFGLLLSACAPRTAPVNRAAEEAAVRALDEQWAATAARNDVEGAVAFYADDAVMLPPNAPIANGTKAIRELWAGMLGPNTSLSWKASKVEVAESGDLGYVYGTYQLSVKDPKAPINDTGKFLEVWKKQADGKWKCIVDTFNSDLPVPPPAAVKK